LAYWPFYFVFICFASDREGGGRFEQGEEQGEGLPLAVGFVSLVGLFVALFHFLFLFVVPFLGTKDGDG
jgi:hypothetical protein